MRAIMFRAWHKHQKKLVRVNWIRFGVEAGFDDNDFNENVTLLKNVELMQYTGLKDKNGKDIYEGDIIKVVEYGYGKRVFYGEVIFVKNCYYIKYYDYLLEEYALHRIGNIYRSWDQGTGEYEITYNYKVLGNIYEHSGILENYKKEMILQCERQKEANKKLDDLNNKYSTHKF